MAGARHITLADLAPLHEAVGRAMTAFADLELAIQFLFASLMEPADRLLSVTAINAVRSFGARLKMVDAVAARALVGDDAQKWQRLHERIQRKKAFRDRLAHGSVGHGPGATTIEEVVAQKPMVLPRIGTGESNLALWHAKGSHRHKGITLDQMTDFRKTTHALVTETFEFGIALDSRPKP